MRSGYPLVSLTALACAMLASPVSAQSAQPLPQDTPPPASAPDPTASAPEVAPPADGADIVVTARGRNETALQTPVVLSAFSSEQLTRLNVTSLTDVAKLTPMLVISPSQGAFGGNLTLRGVASPSGNASSEPAVTVNIDGVPLSYGGVVRLGNIDIGQVEVLKGPQALFFGKNSTGGIVSMHSAEPTNRFESKISTGYEFNARQIDVDGFVSGPVTDTLNVRAAVRVSRQRGYFDNVAPGATFGYAPGTKEAGGRLSANWRPTSQLTVKLRGTYDHVRENGSYSSSQRIACASGAAAGPGAAPGTDDCIANGTVVFAPVPLAAILAATGNPAWNSDSSYLKVTQHLISAELNYAITDSLSLTSVTGFYGIKQEQEDANTSGARYFIGSVGTLTKDSFSQEARLSFKNPDVPVNFMLGGFYQSDQFRLREQGVVNVGGPNVVIRPLSPYWDFPLRSKAYSAFGQVGWDISPMFSASAGLRYSNDKKFQYFVPPAPLPNKFNVPDVSFSNVSPEATLSFKPNGDTNFFASYKQGYKSGAYQVGFNIYGAPLANPAVTNIPGFYKPETVKGFEAGVKVRLFDRQLRLNVSGYSYLYKDLQLSRVDPATFVILIINASSARVKGLEGDLTFTPKAVPGLSITASAALNSAKYASSFLSSCYTGQTIAGGCLAGGVQEFRDRPLPRAPHFSGSMGVLYDTAVSENAKMTFNLNGVYTSRQFLSQELSPIGVAQRRLLLDGSIGYGSKSGSYEFSLIGRNLTNRYYAYSGFQTPSTGSGTGTTNGVLSDFEGPISRGREVWLRLTIRPSAF